MKVVPINAFTLSPSRMKLFASCQRKWYWEYVKGFKAPPSAGQALGTKIHGQIEDAVLKGITPEDPVVFEAYHMLPKDKGTPLVEEWLNVTFPGGVLNRQRADYVYAGPEAEIPEVVDVKTMKNFRYALTGTELQNDIQMISYGGAVLELLRPEALYVKLTHLQVPTQVTDFPRLESTVVDSPFLQSQYEGLKHRFTNRMKIAHEETDPGKIEPNWNACKEYGGCPHVGRCAALGENMPTLESKLKKMAKEAGVKVEETAENASPEEISGGPFTLYVDCLPKVSAGVVSFADWVTPLLEFVTNKAGDTVDFRLVPFGEGKGKLATVIKNAELPSAMYISTRGDMASVAVEVLEARAGKNVIKGFV